MTKILLWAILFVALLFKFSYAKGETMSRTIELNSLSWEFKQADETSWKRATVPGSVHLDLMQNGFIKDPFYRANEREVQWIENKNWEYRATFKADEELLSSERIELDFRGLDTFADVYLNDKLILRADNMHVGWIVDIKANLKTGDNVLRVFFHSPLNHVIGQYESSPIRYPAVNDVGEKKVSVYTRKAPYHYGWDWGPRLVTSGIWRPVYFRAWNKGKIRDVWFKQKSLNALKANLEIEFEIEATRDESFSININSTKNEFKTITQEVKLKAGVNKISVPLVILKPKLWWTNGLGEQKFYDFNIELKQGNALIEEMQKRFGLRTLEVINKPDKYGESFYVKLNGRNVFMKGANYIPSDSFLTRVTPERYKQIFEDMKGANFNMVRVWGGGVYEDDLFYDLADEYGILIWQDFMFACSLYPSDESFLNKVSQEADYNIRRLRNHAALALWCGNNEIDQAWKSWGWQDQFDEEQKQSLTHGYNKLFHQLLAEKVKEHDPRRFYMHSSPMSGWGSLQEFNYADNHFWGVWHDEWPFKDFNTYVPRFMSEYGFQSFPDMNTIERFATEQEDWDIKSDVMKVHQKASKGNGLIMHYMDDHYRQPKDFASFVYVSQLLQAEGIKTAIEAHRRNMPFCMGTLYWQLNDCWTAISWSSIDFYGRWKALHYFVKKAYEPVLISAYSQDDEMKVYLISDLVKPLNGTLKLELKDFHGKPLWSHTQKILIAPNKSKPYYAVQLPVILENLNRNEVVLSLTLENAKKEIVTQTLQYFVEPKDLNLPQPKITFDVETKNGAVELKLKTNVLAKNVYLDFEKDTESFFSDNFFDLLPNEERVVKVKTSLLLEKIKKRLKIKTLADSY